MARASRALPFGLALLAGCGSSRPTAVQIEDFDASRTHSRSFTTAQARTCEAARRALLSQGYVLDTAAVDQVAGKKSYQPQGGEHVEVALRVVCARSGAAGESTIAFASALQDSFALRKVNNSASLGVGVLGSVSLPLTGSEDSLVKVASETITSTPYYDRFFALVERYLSGQPDVLEPPGAAVPAAAATAVPAAPVAPVIGPAIAPAVLPSGAAAAPAAVAPAAGTLTGTAAAIQAPAIVAPNTDADHSPLASSAAPPASAAPEAPASSAAASSAAAPGGAASAAAPPEAASDAAGSS